MAIERRSQRLINLRNQCADIVIAIDIALHDGEFIAAETGDKIADSDAIAQAIRDRLEELIADQMAQRIVDALELIDVDVEDRKLPAGEIGQQCLGMALEQGSVRQIGQGVVMRQMFDPGLETPPLRHVFQRGGPAATRRSLVDQPDHAPVGSRNDGVLDPVPLRIEKRRAIGVDVADERAELLAMQDEVAQMTSGLGHIRRYAEHVDVPLIADHEAARSVEQQQSLRHVVDGGVEMPALLREQPLRGLVLALQPANDQEDHGDDDDDREKRGEKLQPGLCPPVGERGR